MLVLHQWCRFRPWPRWRRFWAFRAHLKKKSNLWKIKSEFTGRDLFRILELFAFDVLLRVVLDLTPALERVAEHAVFSTTKLEQRPPVEQQRVRAFVVLFAVLLGAERASATAQLILLTWSGRPPATRRRPRDSRRRWSYGSRCWKASWCAPQSPRARGFPQLLPFWIFKKLKKNQ